MKDNRWVLIFIVIAWFSTGYGVGRSITKRQAIKRENEAYQECWNDRLNQQIECGRRIFEARCKETTK